MSNLEKYRGIIPAFYACYDEEGNVSPVFEERQIRYQERFIIDTMQREAIKFIENMVEIFKEDIENLYYQKYYINIIINQ